MALRFTQQNLLHIQSLLELPEERFQAFLDALRKAGPNFNFYDLAAEVSSRSKIPRSLTDSVVQTLAQLYLARESQATPLETFLDEQVGPALKNHLVAQPDKAEIFDAARVEIRSAESESRWTRFREFLMVAMSLDDVVGTASKAGPVLTEHERIFVDARVLTDIRPIFHSDLSENPNAAVLIHMLRITTRDILRKETAQYVALDSNDIRFLKQLMDRAIKKEETLKKLMKSAGINNIEPKGIF
jgi:uncharacterized protein (DUF1778 family)